MELADELERLRYEKGLSYRKLADMCNLNQHTMRNALIRNGYKYLMGRIDVLAAALGADAQVLREKYPDPNDKAQVRCGKAHRYDQILEAIREGVPDSRIMAKWPDMTGDVLMVYHKIADGKLCQRSKNGGMYDRRDTAAAEFCAIAFRTGSLRGMTDNYDTYDGVGRW